MRAVRWIIAWLMLVPAAAAAQQQPQTAPRLPASEPYRHRHSGLEIPPVLDGIARGKVATWAADQLDEAVDFSSADNSEFLTIYIFRNVSGSVPVWFDRIRWQVEHRDIYGGTEPLAAEPSFTPPGQHTASGLMMVFTPKKEDFRSTGVALIPLGDWYFEIRYSSHALAPEQLVEHMRNVLAAVHWPDKIAEAPAAELVEPCSTTLTLHGNAKQRAPDGAQALISAVLAVEVSKKPAHDAVPTAPVEWCRDETRLSGEGVNSAVYRASGARDSYMIALNDAGRAISVFPDTLGALLGNERKRWALQLIDVDKTDNYAPLDRLPPPDQAFAVLATQRPYSSATTWGDGKSIILQSQKQ